MVGGPPLAIVGEHGPVALDPPREWAVGTAPATGGALRLVAGGMCTTAVAGRLLDGRSSREAESVVGLTGAGVCR